MNNYKSPLHKMAETTATDFWNDSCAADELSYAIDNGAVGATTNPVIVGKVLSKEYTTWFEPIKKMKRDNPAWSEIDIAWQLNEEMAVRGAKLLHDVYEREKGLKGRISIQTNAQFYRSAEKILEQTLRFGELADNIQVKIPVTEAGIQAIEEASFRGISINATVSFSVAQAIAVAEAVERGLRRREENGDDTNRISSVCTIMVGRVDDWLKAVCERDDIITDQDYLEWGGVAVMKRAYEIFMEKGYKTRLLSAAYRNHYHWSEFIGGEVSETIPYKWQLRFNSSDVEVKNRMQNPVDPKIVEELSTKLPEFSKMYEPKGMEIGDFDTLGATVRTLRQFLKGYAELLEDIRNIMLPDPDKK